MRIRHFLVGAALAAQTAFATTPPYSTNFSSDPGWITDQPGNYYWAAASETYHVRAENHAPAYQPNRYFYKQLDNPVGNFTLTYDVRIDRCDWSAGIDLGVFDSNLKGSGSAGGQSIYIDFGNPDPGRGIGLFVFGSSGNTSAWSGGGKWSPGRAYRSILTYGSAANTVDLQVLDIASNAIIWTSPTLAVPGGGFSNPLRYLGGSRYGMGDTNYNGVDPNAVAEGAILSVSLVPEPATLALALVASTMMTRRKR